MSGPLTGLKIIEFAGLGPAPFAAMMLADMGADVLRIDRLNQRSVIHPQNPATDILNRNRRSIKLDLKHPQAIEIALQLVEQADILLEGFRPGVMERLGLGPEICQARNGRLIYGRMTGWGQEGELAHKAGHDINYIAMTGVLDAIGSADGGPMLPLNLIGDFGGGGMLLAFGVLCALHERQSSGKGQVVDAAIVDGTSLLMSMIYGFRADGTWNSERGTNLLDGGAPFYQVYECRDGQYISIGSLEPKFYAALLKVLGLSEEALPAQMDRSGWPRLKRRFAEIFKTKSRAEWSEIMAAEDLCFAPVLTMDEATDDPHLNSRHSFTVVGGVSQPSPAPRFSRTAPDTPRPAGALGEHTAHLLAELGYSAEAVRLLRQQQVVA